MRPWSLPAEKTLSELASNAERGLTSEAAARRLAADGPNEYRQAKPESVASMVLRQFRDVANLILVLAAALSLALAVREGHGYL